MKNKNLLYASIFLNCLWIAPVYSQSPSGGEDLIQEYLNAETTEARNLLSGFSFELLENYANEYTSSKDIKESRKLWIVEEYYKRKADKTASDRLFYVFLAVTLLMSLIFLLTFRIYQMQKNLSKQDGEDL